MSLLDPEKIKEQYDDAHTAMKSLWENFDEYERIARNKPHPRVIQAKLPTVTDGTLAGVIAAQPKRVIQQIPTGSLISTANPDLQSIANYIWVNEILKNANYNGTSLQKSWIMTRKALTYGSQASYSFFRKSGDHFGADFSIPYMKDLILEAGKTYGPDCDILYLRQWYTKAQIQLIIDNEENISARRAARKEAYQGDWDVPQLKELLNHAKSKDAEAATATERDKGLVNKFIEVIHAFQSGAGQNFYSFAPDLASKDSKSTTAIIRTRKNKDPRGKMPINFMYADVDLSNPLGVGYPEMSGGMQNLLDSEVQSYQLQQKIGLNPPIRVWGTGVKKASIKYKPNAIWDMGADPGAKAEPVDINTEAITNFPNNYGMLKSQILNLHPTQTSTVSASVGNSQSKTPKGVEQADQNLGFEDNYVRKMYEEWFEANAESLLNIHFAESNGTREIELTEEYLKYVQPEDPAGKSASKAVSFNRTKQTAIVDYSRITDQKFRWIVDPTTSESPDDATQSEDLQTLISEAQQAPYLYYYLLNAGYKLNLGEAYKQKFQRLGLNNIEKIIQKLPEPKEGDPEGPTEDQLRGVLNPLYDKPSVSMSYKDLPPAAQVQALANAGITVTVADVLMGPVIDPNVRGVETPEANPNTLWPTGPNGATPPTPDGSALPPTAATQPTTQVQETMPGPPAPPAAPALPAGVPQPAPGPAEGAPGPLANMSPTDRNLLATFLREGYSARQAVQALQMAHEGKTTEEIQQALGTPDHSPAGIAPNPTPAGGK